jgi:hypothetical protein
MEPRIYFFLQWWSVAENVKTEIQILFLFVRIYLLQTPKIKCIFLNVINLLLENNVKKQLKPELELIDNFQPSPKK